MNSHVICVIISGTKLKHVYSDRFHVKALPTAPPCPSPFGVRNPLESPFDKGQEILQGQDSDRKPGKVKVLFWLNSPIVCGLGTADCLRERVECDIERRNDVL